MLDDLQNLLKNANLDNLTSNVSKIQQQLEKVQASGTSGAGMVIVTLNGKHKCTNLELSDDLFNEEKEVIIDLISSAINQASNNIQQALQQQAAQTLATTFTAGNK
jgi:nucleoid-associated protein EbfC